MHYLFYKVRQQDIVLIKFLLEAYENIMVLSTVDKAMPKIQVTVSPDYLSDALGIITDLRTRFFMQRLDEDETVSQGNY